MHREHMISKRDIEIPVNLNAKSIRQLMEENPTITIGKFKKKIGSL